MINEKGHAVEVIDGAPAWRRLVLAMLMSTIGGVGMWSTVVVLPVIEAEFGVDRGGASLPFTVTLLGFATGGIIMGRFMDRHGIIAPLLLGTVSLASGYILASMAQSYGQFLTAQAILIGMFGSSAFFAPLVAEISHWFNRRRGIAVALVASGNYLAGAVWPPILHLGIETIGWRESHLAIGLFCLVVLLPLAWPMRRPLPETTTSGAAGLIAASPAPFNLSPPRLQFVLIIAGITCCIAMAMPQVHIVAYCADLGYGTGRGAEMLSLMLATGVASRLISGLIADRIGGLGTLLLGSTLQCVALLFYLPFDGLVSLYIVSALFGLSQGGIVPSYALIVREFMPAREAGARVSAVLMSTVVGMALGGWISGEIYDLTGSYQAAFLNGIAFNLVNMAIALWLIAGVMRRRALA